LAVSEIGFGAWGIGGTSWIGAQDVASQRALVVARDAGINFFDTALAYGDGHSERLLSQTFGSSREIIIATKIPPLNLKWPAPAGVPLAETFPKNHVLACLVRSLRNLERECIDLLQYHVWSDEWADDAEWLDTIAELRRSGLVRYVGISINDHEPENVLRALDTGLIDCVQVIYNIFDQSPADKLFPYCRNHNIGIIARVPFDEGSLAGKVGPQTTFPDRDFRNHYFSGNRKRQVWERVQRLVADLDVTVEELPELALRFCLSHPAVSTVIPGMRTPEHVMSNAAASDHGVLSQAELDRLGNHRWIRNFYMPSPTVTARLRDAIGMLKRFA
jgi:aryl-alcohol dehydrogenase-like predicted oxidoreductase